MRGRPINETLTRRYGVAEHLRTSEEMAAYLAACREETACPEEEDGGAALVAKALEDIARAKALSPQAGTRRTSPATTPGSSST